MHADLQIGICNEYENFVEVDDTDDSMLISAPFSKKIVVSSTSTIW